MPEIKLELLETEGYKEKLEGWIPDIFNEKLKRLKEELAPMREEAPEHVVYQASVLDLIGYYIANAPEGTSVATNTCCAGAGVQVSGSALYRIDRYVGATLPSGGVRVTKVEAGKSEEIGRIAEFGRMGGPFGWAKGRDLIAGALASFTHNWVGFLGLFRSRPRLPLSNPWPLPNLTLRETVAPEQFHMPASMAYSIWRPSFIKDFYISMRAPTPVKVGIDFWDPFKNDLARIDEVDVPQGDTVTRIRMTATIPTAGQRGMLTINPTNAPQGLTVMRVDTRPASV